MKIGTCIQFSSMEEMPAKLSMLRENNFDTCQLLAWNTGLWTAENAARLKEMLSEHGVAVSAFWCGWEGP